MNGPFPVDLTETTTRWAVQLDNGQWLGNIGGKRGSLDTAQFYQRKGDAERRANRWNQCRNRYQGGDRTCCAIAIPVIVTTDFPV